MSKKPSWLTARQAAALLDVKLATLYAYKSRGWIESIPAPDGSRQHRYARTSVERLKARHDARKGHRAVAAAALRFGEPSLETSVSEIRGDGPYYRGHAAVELCSRGVSFEAVCDLLLEGQLPTSCDWSRALGAGPLLSPRSELSRCEMALVLQRKRGVQRVKKPVSTYLACLLGLASLADRTRIHGDDRSEHTRARRIIAWLAQRVGPHRVKQRPRSIAQCVLLSLGTPPSEPAVSVVNSALILCADHELNASTFAARVTASTGGDLYACIGSALLTLSGTRHGEASARLEAQLHEIERPGDAARFVHERTAHGRRIHGFGQPLYPQGDPRGRLLFELAEQAKIRAPQRGTFARLQALREAAQRAGFPGPNLDGGLVAVCSALGLPKGSAAALFAIGRCPGWVAHALEQRPLPFVLRPRALYVTPHCRPEASL